MSTDPVAASPEQAAFVSELARPYLWWEPIGRPSDGIVREIAQIMNLDSYEDTLRLEGAVGDATLVAVMRQAQPGWFDARSWDFWRGRLARRVGVDLPDAPPRRKIPKDA